MGYCWWLKSCTTKDDDCPIIQGFNHPRWCRILFINSMLVPRRVEAVEAVGFWNLSFFLEFGIFRYLGGVYSSCWVGDFLTVQWMTPQNSWNMWQNQTHQKSRFRSTSHQKLVAINTHKIYGTGMFIYTLVLQFCCKSVGGYRAHPDPKGVFWFLFVFAWTCATPRFGQLTGEPFEAADESKPFPQEIKWPNIFVERNKTGWLDDGRFAVIWFVIFDFGVC